MQKGRIREAGPEQSGQSKGREICASLPFASVCVYSECILFGRTVIIGLELTVRGISHQIDFLRTVRSRLVQQGAEGRGSGIAGTLLSAASVFPPELGHPGNRLNRIHLEIVLNSVCCVDPSLDVYFNSAATLLLIYYIGICKGGN